jgi:TolB-like protein
MSSLQPPTATLASATAAPVLSVLLQCELDDAGGLLAQDATGVQERWGVFCTKAQRMIGRQGGQLQRHYLLAWLAHFTDARAALRVAWGLHAAVQSINRQQAAEHHLQLRIGVHASAQRWEALDPRDPCLLQVAELAHLAAAGETVVSTAVRDQLVDDLDATVQDLGDCLLKREPAAVRAFRLSLASAPASTAPSAAATPGVLPAVAVIPFTPRHADDRFFAVGELLADRVIDQLSRSRHVRVISRLTGTAFRQRDDNPLLIRDHLRARYVLTGGYRVVGHSLQGQLRLDATLTDTQTGEVIWVEPALTGSVGDLLSRASELAHTLASGAHHAMLETEVQALQQQALSSLDHYALMLGGITLMHRATRDDFHTSRQALDALLEREPQLHTVHAWLAKWYVLRVTRGLTADPRADAREALAHAQAAQCEAGALSLGLAMEGFVRLHLLRDFDAALHCIDRACRHNPSEPLAWLFGGVVHSFLDHARPALDASDRALALSPLDPLLYYFESLAASSAIVAGQHERAIALCQRSLHRNVTHLHTHRALLTALWAAGRTDEARVAAQRLLRLSPGYTVAAFRRTAASADTRLGRQMAEALLASGIPPG